MLRRTILAPLLFCAASLAIACSGTATDMPLAARAAASCGDVALPDDASAPPSPSPSPSPSAVNSIDALLDDMRLPSDAMANGPPGDSAIVMMQPPTDFTNPSGSNCHLTVAGEWGMIQDEASGNPATNVRVEVRDLQLWVLRASTQQWERIAQSNLVTPSGGVDGAFNVLEFHPQSCPAGCNLTPGTGDTCDCPTDVLSRVEPGGASISVAIPGDRFYQPWTFSSAPFGDVRASFATYRARLIVADPSKPDDRASARIVANVGIDWIGVDSANGLRCGSGAGHSRRHRLTSAWSAIDFVSVTGATYTDQLDGQPLTEAELRANPPPLD